MSSLAWAIMNEAVEPVLEDSLERQNRFISDNLRRIFLLVYRMVGNVADAQDLTQEVFVKALQRRDQLKDEEKAAHWLSRIATNTAIDFLRRHGRIAFCDLDDMPERAGSSPMESPEARVLRAERRAILEGGLETLTARERAALLLRTWRAFRRKRWLATCRVRRLRCGRTSPMRG